jgi:hypothetical protein
MPKIEGFLGICPHFTTGKIIYSEEDCAKE